MRRPGRHHRGVNGCRTQRYCPTATPPWTDDARQSRPPWSANTLSGPGDRVGLVQARRFETIAAMLGIATAGASYVPLDPELPVGPAALCAGRCRCPRRLVGGLRVCRRGFPGVVPIQDLSGEPPSHTPAPGPQPALCHVHIRFDRNAERRRCSTPGCLSPRGRDRFHGAGPRGHGFCTSLPSRSMPRHWKSGDRCLTVEPACSTPTGCLDPGKLEAVDRQAPGKCLWLTATLFNQVVAQRPVALGQLDTLLFGGERASVSACPAGGRTLARRRR